jgi:polysaccharide biosynthesis protein PslH
VISSKKYKKKLVFCLSRFPFPIEKGDKLRAFFQLRELSEDFDIYLICTTQRSISKENYNKILPFCKEIHCFKQNLLIQLVNLFLNIFSRKPFQVAFFTQRGIQLKINHLLISIKPDHIFCQLIRPAEYVKNYHDCPKTIDLMDALSMGMERRASKSNFLKRLVYGEESIRLKQYERQILNYFENILIISKQDKEFIIHPKQAEIIVMPNGVNESFLEKNIAPNLKRKYHLIFTGNMSYFPNIEATHWIFEELYPYFHQKGYKIAICGANPSYSIVRLSRPADFIITGWVDDIRQSYLASKLFIAPMFSGSGMQNKILEAMALGIPCITTTIANNAILAEPNIEILIANTREEFISKIEECLINQNLYAQLSSNGRAFVEKKYNWKNINRELITLINNSIS